jgi:LysM repeat protein
VELPRRGDLTRFAAPAAFLVAVTIAALLIRAGFQGGSSGSSAGTTAGTTTTRPAATTTASTSTSTSTTTTARRFYTIQAGDTLDVVAAKYAKTVDELLALNPGVDPHALRIGQKIRVG